MRIDLNAYNAYNRGGYLMTVREIITLITDDGWFWVSQSGSHAKYKHPDKNGIITVPMHRGDLKKKTAASILKQAGIKK